MRDQQFPIARRELKRDVLQRAQLHFIFSPGSTMSTPEAARLLNVSTQTIRMMIESEELKGYKNRPDRASSPYRVFRQSLATLMDRIVNEYNLHGVGTSSANPATPTTGTPPAR